MLHCAIPFDARGLEVQDNSRTLGMRGTGSHDIVLEGLRAGRRDQCPPPGGEVEPVWHVVATIALPLIYRLRRESRRPLAFSPWAR